MGCEQIEGLASCRRILERIRSTWGEFLKVRAEHLRADGRFGNAPEQVTENILRDLFSIVLDWQPGDLNHQVEYADFVLTTLGIKHLVIEAKRPRALAFSQPAIDSALGQARRYAARQLVDRIAISDGFMLYAADLENGQVKNRVFVRLDAELPPETPCGGLALMESTELEVTTRQMRQLSCFSIMRLVTHQPC